MDVDIQGWGDRDHGVTVVAPRVFFFFFWGGGGGGGGGGTQILNAYQLPNGCAERRR